VLARVVHVRDDHVALADAELDQRVGDAVGAVVGLRVGERVALDDGEWPLAEPAPVPQQVRDGGDLQLVAVQQHCAVNIAADRSPVNA
jgi:hypothetical protein